MNSTSKSSSRLFRWLWVGIVTIVILWITQQIIVKPIIEAVSSQLVGTRVTMGSFSLNIFTHRIRITDLRIYNEQGFPPKIFFNAPEILVDVNLVEAIQGKYHFPLIIFHLDKMIVFKNAQGKLNVDELKIVKERLHAKTKGPAPNFKIDELQLNVEQVIVEDDSKTPPLIEAYDLNLKNKTIRDINGVPKLISVVMVEVLKPTAIQSAGLYAATTLLGVGFLPGLAIGLAMASDDAVSELPNSSDQIYQKCLELVNRLGGQIKNTNAQTGKISVKIYNCDVSINIQKEGWIRSYIIIKARKYLLAKPEIAAGLLYQLKESLK